jgi:hypothetical protein
MLNVFQNIIDNKIIKYLDQNVHKLVPDISNYAKGRLRAWIGLEAPLTDKQFFKLGQFSYNDFIWKWLNQFCIDNLQFVPEIALVHIGGADCSDPDEQPTEGRGGTCGIKEHRDAGYADFRAVGINIHGNATFGYRSVYPHQDRWSKVVGNDAKLEIIQMTTGTSVVFNCKNPHFAQVGPNRWCINAWRIRDKRRKDFEQILQKYNFQELIN